MLRLRSTFTTAALRFPAACSVTSSRATSSLSEASAILVSSTSSIASKSGKRSSSSKSAAVARKGASNKPSNKQQLQNGAAANSAATAAAASASGRVVEQQPEVGAEEKSALHEEEEGGRGEEEDAVFVDPRSHLPDTLLVQLCDHMQHDQGVKRHAITVTFGGDSFEIANLVRDIRRDLKGLLATTYWQMNQTHERTAFFVCTRVSHGTADMLVTSMTQRVLSHVEEKFGYEVKSTNVTLSPDVQHTSVRMLYQYFVFKKRSWEQLEAEGKVEKLSSSLIEGEDGDQVSRFGEPKRQRVAAAVEGNRGTSAAEEENDGAAAAVDDEEAADNFDEKHQKGLPEFRNFEAPRVGPQEPSKPPKQVPPRQAVSKIWDDRE